MIVAISLTTFGLLKNFGSGGASTSQIEKVVADYIKEHPEEILKSVSDYQQKSQADSDAAAQKTVSEKTSELENDKSSPIAGNPKGDVTIVQFFDYSCGYCKRVMPEISSLIEEDKNLKVVFKEFPILGPNSLLASHASLAVNMVAPEKYFEFHKALTKATVSGKDSVLKIASDLGIDKDKVSAKMDSDEVKKEIEKNAELARSIGVRGTPAFVIGGTFVPGAIGKDDFKKLIAESRSKK